MGLPLGFIRCPHRPYGQKPNRPRDRRSALTIRLEPHTTTRVRRRPSDLFRKLIHLCTQHGELLLRTFDIDKGVIPLQPITHGLRLNRGRRRQAGLGARKNILVARNEFLVISALLRTARVV